jgi:hypothetical protein
MFPQHKVASKGIDQKRHWSNNICKQANDEHTTNKERKRQKFIEDQTRAEYSVESMKRRIDVSLNKKFSGKQAAGRRHKKTKNEKNKKKRKIEKKNREKEVRVETYWSRGALSRILSDEELKPKSLQTKL